MSTKQRKSLPLAKLHHVPGSNLLGGAGERRTDCARLDACEDAWTRYTMRTGYSTPAHCHAACPSWERAA